MSDEATEKDRITEVRIQGMRALADVRLPLGGLTVLIGENGSGKSTIIEALEILRKAALPGNFVNDQLGPFHGGLDTLLRAGENTLRIGVRIDGREGRFDYSFALTKQWISTIVSEERLDLWEGPNASEARHVLARDASGCQVWDSENRQQTPYPVAAGQLALPDMVRFHDAVTSQQATRLCFALSGGRAHVPFDVRTGSITAQPAPTRLPARLAVANELDRLGGNLANCYHRLSNGSTREVWERVMERVRAGIGHDVVNVRTPAVGPSLIDLVIDFHGLPAPVPAHTLSDGQLAYLAFVALAELGKEHSFVAFDEPEAHLHPELLVRVVWLLDELAESCPVILSTQSDRLLDALLEPAKSVILCELNPKTRATKLYRPDEEALKNWLKRYSGLGELRAQGFAHTVFREPMGNGV